jgi:hypothetical protein
MNTKTVCLFFLTVLIFFVISYLFIDFIPQRNNPVVMLVVAKHDYPKGTAITDPEQMFELREFPEVDEPIDAYKNFDELSPDLILSNDIHEGQPLQRRSAEDKFTKALKEFIVDHPPGPGRRYLAIRRAIAHEGSIRVGTYVDVFQIKSEAPPNDTAKILLHDVPVRLLMAGSKKLQEILYKEGKTDIVALGAIVEASLEEGLSFQKELFQSICFELRPSANNKHVDEKNSDKNP